MTAKKNNPSAIQYEDYEQEYIDKINKLMTFGNQNAYEIGKLTDCLIESSGGVKYGTATLERITKHPKCDCSQKHIRRCWSYYLLHRDYGMKLEKMGLCASALYELSRFLNRGLLPEEEEKWILACATKATQDVLSVERISRLVTGELKTLGKIRKTPKPRPPKKTRPKLEWPGASADAFKPVADAFEQLAKPDKLANLNKYEVKRGAIGVLRPLVEIVEQVAHDLGTDEDFSLFLTKTSERLAAVARSLGGHTNVKEAA